MKKDNDKSSTKEKILIEASELFAKKGFAGTSTRKIAKAVGVSHPALYKHFGSKEDILLALFDYALNIPLQYLEKLKEEKQPASIKLFRFLYFYAVHLRSSPYNLSPLMQSPEWHYLPKVVEVRKGLNYLDDTIQDIISEGIKSGEFIDVDPGAATQAILAINESTMVWDKLRAGNIATTVAGRMTRFSLRSLLKDVNQLDWLHQTALPDE